MTSFDVAAPEDVLVVRGAVSELAMDLGFGRRRALELELALWELGSNLVRYAEGGRIALASVTNDEGVAGIEILASDQGPGIADVDAAMVDGYSTGGSLGLGLGAARRLSDEFTIESAAGQGTRIRLVKWNRSPS